MKRKGPPSSAGNASKRRRHINLMDARTIATQTTGQAFKNGEVDVDKFVKAREFEINALEQGLKRAQSALNTRAFQNVPRSLRRRTASHDVRRIPKRLRSRAKREIIEDNTPTGSARVVKRTSKSRLRIDIMKLIRQKQIKQQAAKRALKSQSKPSGSKPATQSDAKDASTDAITTRKARIKQASLREPSVPKARFRKRQIHKTWLPTHLYYAKRAHMTPPREPLWRFAIPMSPNDKSYRSTHRASHTNGTIAWDVSYMSSIGVEGRQDSLLSFLRTIGLLAAGKDQVSKGQSNRLLEGRRSLSGWLHEPSVVPPRLITQATAIWCSLTGGSEEKEPSTQAKAKPPKRQLLLRVHPSAFLQVWRAVIKAAKIQKPQVRVEDLRFEIGSIEMAGPASLDALLGTLHPALDTDEENNGSTQDCWRKLRQVQSANSLPANAIWNLNVTDPRLHYPPHKSTSTPKIPESDLVEFLAAWPIDKLKSSTGIFDRAHRYKASKALPSQRAIDRRRALSRPGEYPTPAPTDPHIPVMLLAHRTNGTGSFTLILPWKCVKPVWYTLMYYPLLSGGNPHLGCLNQQRQIAFEREEAWFPADFPGTEAGWQWEACERVKREAEWAKIPKSKRVNWDAVKLGPDRKGEVGRGWTCDWEMLVHSTPKEGPSTATSMPMPPMKQVTREQAISYFAKKASGESSEANAASVVCVRIRLLKTGVPRACARIYRLPTDITLRRQWLRLLEPANRSKANKSSREALQKPASDAPIHIRRQYLAAQMLRGPEMPRVGQEGYPCVPPEEDLIGFVTTGNYNLGEGKGSGIGSVMLSKVTGEGKERYICIIRDAGSEIGRLARWEAV